MKLKTRLWISFTLACALFLFALPRLPFYGTTIEFGFGVLWLALCVLVIGANLYGILRLGRGERVAKPVSTREQREAIRRINRYKPRRMRSH
ncbi:hypothetical protein [Bacillus horti]|uniref:Type VI protein secretion system component VasK n=2 Tax=Caldalkalibacillus horti TaxID=77523 RepID=A0ABT9W430_9BACI|nr:hypothetical protein [Bacillus horti]MDQ0167984.1 type VI protein secretion system component VasK [Bacillus horti]